MVRNTIDVSGCGCCCLYIAITFAVLALAAASVFGLQCPPHPGPFGSSALTPDGRHLVCLIDAAVPGKYELYAVDGIHNPWRLSPGMADDRDVIRFAISPDSQRVAFTCDRTTWTKYDLYTVAIGGGAAVKINGPLPVEHDVDGFAWADARMVYVQGRNTTGFWELFSADRVAPVRTKLAPWSTVGRFFSVIDGERVRFSADATGFGVVKAYVVPAVGGEISEEVFADGFESGNSGGWR